MPPIEIEASMGKLYEHMDDDCGTAPFEDEYKLTDYELYHVACWQYSASYITLDPPPWVEPYIPFTTDVDATIERNDKTLEIAAGDYYLNNLYNEDDPTRVEPQQKIYVKKDDAFTPLELDSQPIHLIDLMAWISIAALEVDNIEAEAEISAREAGDAPEYYAANTGDESAPPWVLPYSHGIDFLRSHIRMNNMLLKVIREQQRKSCAPNVTLAQYSRAEIYQDHGLGLKVVDGLFDISMGHDTYELAPRNGKSNERYILTAAKADCSSLFALDGVRPPTIKAVVDTVNTLLKDPQAAAFTHEGRVWFTTNKIVEELLRTDAGTVSGKSSKHAHELVDRVLVAVTGARVQSTSPDGTATNVVYILDGVRLEKATFNGEIYTDVWGFLSSTPTLTKQAAELGQTYSYPLPSRAKPFTLDTVGIENYLSDLLHEARGKLYYTDKNGVFKKRPRVTSYVIKRAWQDPVDGHGIFNKFSPTRELNPRQKKRLVEAFEDELTDLVREESHGERHKGAPLYIRAWSEREAGRGSHGGAYRYLVIEASTTFRTVRDGQNGHGRVNLRDGQSHAAPDNTPK